MSYQSILVHACDSPSSAASYQLAARVALAEGAHLTGLAFSSARDFVYRAGAAAAIVPLTAGDLAFLTESAERDLRAFNAALASLNIAHLQSRVSDTSAEQGLPLEARYADLLVIGQQCTPVGIVADRHSVARTVLVHAPCPVLVVPDGVHAKYTPQNALIAWDGSMEASRAVRGALPLLKYAAHIAIVTFEPPQLFFEEHQPGDTLAQYLACHGAEATVIDASRGHDVGSSLLDLAQERDCDMLVMGCFSHTRFREIILGGTTERVLSSTRIPVLMSH